MMKTAATVVLVATTAAFGTPPPEPSYVDVRSYMPEGFVTDGSVDYKPQIQRCFDENLCVLFPGSDDPDRPVMYGVTAETVGKMLATRPHSRIRFGPNAVLKRLPSFGKLLRLGVGTHLTGAVVDGNKYAHWPLVKDRKVEYYAFVIGAAIVMQGRNVLRDCVVHSNAGIAFAGWHSSDNKIYRSRAENCGFLEAMNARRWTGEHASADGFFFALRSGYNLIKDCVAIDCTRWDFVPTEHVRHSTFVDCRGGDVHVQSYGFIDVESAGPGNSLVRCRSPNSRMIIQQGFQHVIGCTTSALVAEHAEHPLMLANTITGGGLRACEVRDDRLVMPGRESPMLAGNRIFMAGASPNHSLTVVGSDGLGTAAGNVLYGHEQDGQRSTEMLLYGVGARAGNLQTWGRWQELLEQFARPYYLHSRMDFDFKERFDGD